jgi:outer membrane protein assembly factor BamD (BamD/ComL family)
VTPRRAEAPQIGEDARLLREARGALAAGDASRALALLDTHRARFPGSALAPEREAERVFALASAGRGDEARAAARAFLAAHPSGPLAARVRAAAR